MVSDAGFGPALFFTPNEVPHQTRRIGVMEHRTDHDTVYTAWKAVILPLNQRCFKDGAGREICTPEAFAAAYKAAPFVYSGIPAYKVVCYYSQVTGFEPVT